MALSVLPSSSFTQDWEYDVFLSFRGKDTRTTFTGNLCESLRRRGIRTFFDEDELRRGEKIEPSLVNAIRESRIAIVIFSQNYASSAFCLNELANILDCSHGKHQFVWPIFYKVDPSEIRHLRGSFKDSFTKHEERFKDDKEKVLKWRLALQKAADLSGYHLKSEHEYEHKFIERIVEEVSRKINHIPLHVADNPVGLESTMLEVIPLLELELDDRVNMLGIYGAGGMGKSTVARALFNNIADQFEGTCFLGKIREKSSKYSIEQLQETLLSKVVGESNIKLGDDHEGVPLIMRRLKNLKVLLVIDDVDKPEQLRKIAGGKDWFGKGSRVIITTRNKQLLSCHGIDRVFEVKELNHDKALELLSWNAFKNHEVDPKFKDLSNRIVFYAGGLPLALEIIGSNLFGKGIDKWPSAIAKYESIPIKQIHEVLKVSYDDLDYEEQEIFLDVACCFKGNSKETIETMLDACGFHTKYSIGVLIDKCLVKVDCGRVTMHDLIERMGKEIVRQESMKDVGQRSRLWSVKDIVDVLEENRGSDKVEVIILDPPEEIEVHWDGKAFKEMKNLRMLIIRNTRFSRRVEHLPNSLRVLEWWKYPSSPFGLFPSDFHGKQLVMINFSYTCFLWDKSLQDFQFLSSMSFRGCLSLRQIPDLSGSPNLKQLNLDYCRELIEINDSVGLLRKLESLSVFDCYNLSLFPRAIKLPSLRSLNLDGCQSLKSFPEILEENENELTIRLTESGIEELPSSILKLKGLKNISLSGCGSLNRVPGDILMLPRLEKFRAVNSRMFHFCESSEGLEKVERSTKMSLKSVVDISDCHLKDEFLLSPTFGSLFYHVTYLDLSYNSFTKLPASFKQCHSLQMFELSYCKQLREIEGIPPNIIHLWALECTSLSSQCSIMLATQAMLKATRVLFLPAREMPKWLDYSCNGGKLTFWFRKKVPVIALCFLLEHDLGYLPVYCKFDVQINGSKKFSFPFCKQQSRRWFHSGGTVSLVFCNLNSFWFLGEVTFLEHAWNRVEITQDIWMLMDMGVYVNKQETSMEDIRFKDPYLHREKDLGACETSGIQLPQHSTLSNTMTPWVKELCLNTHNDLDAMNWESTSNVLAWGSDIVPQQGHGITDSEGEGMEIDEICKMMHLLDLNYLSPMEEDELTSDCQ